MIPPVPILCPWEYVDIASLEGGEAMVQFILQLGVVLIAARTCGYLFRQILHLPHLLGHVAAGILIGPFALGGLHLFGFPALFPASTGIIPVSTSLYAMASVGSILLLFCAGLETDLVQFIRYSAAGTGIGLAGAIISFAAGDLCTVWMGCAASPTDPSALFMGTVATATSIGITAQILSERRRTDSPEGVTILASAVIDDVLGIVLLAVVAGMAHAGNGIDSSTSLSYLLGVSAKSIGLWFVGSAIVIFAAPQLSRWMKLTREPGTIAGLSLGLAFFFAGLSELAGLAMIIGAYVSGIALSRTDLAGALQQQLRSLKELLVPVFFCVMGMLVNLRAIEDVLIWGLIYSAAAVIAKVFGCGIFALCFNFNLYGALRIGLGMLPRGEVSLIIAGVGLTSGVIGSDLFGVAILMTLLTTMMAPPLLLISLRGGSGVTKAHRIPIEPSKGFTLDFPSEDIADFVLNRIVRSFRQEEFFVNSLPGKPPIYQFRKDDMAITIRQEGGNLEINSSPGHGDVARFIALEELISLQDLIHASNDLASPETLGVKLVKDMYPPTSSPAELE